MYLIFDIFSSFKSTFSQSAVNTGAELISKVTSPDDMYCNAYIKNQLTEKTENIPVIEASFNIVI